ncbi:hypothetical protein QFC22_002997 [Naganishia vaughanmartiniae]|uniref:Uncharacterized protein n=1 Tax=Naganishia vaughanmartiniae TaxID=1424756 RepID=A0ACC2X7R4_9TREE|nr:hypothetical protein QFC22_002997 [Naganishia vaughanmartiniae]
MPRPEPAFARRWRHKFNAALDRQTGSTTTVKEGSEAFIFPLAQYISLHLILSGFLLFSLGFLPRSQAWLDGILPLLKIAPSAETKPATLKQTISADRPEHLFLTPLTANINVTLAWTIGGLVVSMIWWGAHLRRWWVASRTAERAAGSQVERDNTVKAAQKALLAAVAGSFILYPLLVILGAPITSHVVQTYLFALHFSLLTILPTVYALGIPSLYEAGSFERYRLTRLFCELEYVHSLHPLAIAVLTPATFRPRTQLERATVYPVFGALVGAWFGVIPLALDWDRPWQTWPLPPVLTSIIGFIIGGLASFMHSITVEAVEASKAAVTTQAEAERAEQERNGEKSKRKKRKGGKAA